MSKVQAAQLLARGVQDVWLSGDPQVSFYRSSHKRHVPFATTIERFLVPIDGKIVVNPKSDLLGYTFLTAYDQSTGALVPNIDWSTIISTVELVIGNQIIATHDIVYINTIQKSLEAETFSKRSATPAFQPLGFFFDRQALPLVALKYTDVKINITWASSTAATKYLYRCWSHCVHLGEDERQFFAGGRHQMLIPRVQRVPVSSEPSFYGPLKYIAAPLSTPGEWQAVTTGTSGSINVFVQSIVSTSSNIYTLSIARNTDALVYNSDGSLFTTVVKTGADDGIITKHDKITGQVIWVTRIGGSSYDNPYYIMTDDNENVYLTGATASNPIIFYSTDGSSVSVSSAAGFLVKYNKDGIVQWATRTNSGDFRKLDTEGSNVYIAGYFTSATLTAYDAPGTSSSIPTITRRTATDAVLIKYSSSGVAQWMTSIAGNVSRDNRQTLSVNSTGVYVGTYCKNPTITVYDAPGTTSSLAPPTVSSGNTAFVVTKFDFSGKGVWTQMTTGNFTTTDNASIAFSTKDASNSMYITHGKHPASGNIYVYDTSGSLVNTYSAANTWNYIMKYDQNGSVLWLNIIQSAGGISNPTISGSNLVVSVSNPTSSSYTNDAIGTNWSLIITYDLVGNVISNRKITGTNLYNLLYNIYLFNNNVFIRNDGAYIRIYDTNSNTIYKTITNPTAGSSSMAVTASLGL